MDHPEKIPESQNGQAFPMNDITEKRLYEKVDSWFTKVKEYDRKQFIAHINLYGRHPSSMMSDSEKTHRSAMELCKKWDLVEHEKYRMTTFGYQACQSFTNETRLIPPTTVDFSEQLGLIGLEQQNAARKFGQRAWASMRGDAVNNGHKNVHQTLSRLSQHIQTAFNIYDDIDIEHIETGISLPYLLSVSSRLVGYSSGVNDFNGMIELNEKSVDQLSFSKYFIKNISLAIEPPYEPKK